MKMVSLVLGIVLSTCFTVVLPQPQTKQGVAGITRIDVVCSITEDITGSNVFWIINGSTYGLLQVPRDFTVCSRSCDLTSLAIPVVKSEMDGITLQCVGIDYHNNTQYLGGVTVLEVIPLPQGQLNRNVSPDETQERTVLDYPQFSVGPVNTTIGWTYSNLTCHPSVFIIQGYTDRDDIPDNPSLNLTSTSSVLTFPINISNGALYWRILAHDVAGTPCAQESIFFKGTNEMMTPVLLSPSSDGVECVPIPVGPRQDYSSLEVVWPERRDTVMILCYCPPFEGEHHLFSRCISTTSCDTDYSITVSNGSVCFDELSPPLTSIPVYFTLLESCADSRCVIRLILASFIIEIGQTTPSLSHTTFEDSTNFSKDINTLFQGSTGTATNPNSVSNTLIVAAIMGTLFLIMLLSCPPIFMLYCCYKDRKMKELKRLLHQKQEREPSPISLETASNLHPSDYEEIQELQATASRIPSWATEVLSAAYTFTKCPAYAPRDIFASPPLPHLSTNNPTTPRVHEYEDIEEVH